MSSDAAVFLRFEVAPATWLAPIESVREVLRFGELTSVPRMPRCVRGLTNVRGSVIAVVDLAARFGFAQTEPGAEASIVVFDTNVDGKSLALGILTNSFADVLTIEKKAVQPPPSFGTAIDVAYLDAVVRMDDRFALVMNVARVLSVDEMLAIQSGVAA